MGIFSAKTSTYDPMSAYTPEQQEAIKALQGLAATGSGGGITLGELYGGSLGEYQMTEGELEALKGLQGIVSGSDIEGARGVYERMASNKFNPDDPTSGYASFSKALAKLGAEAQDALNRQAAITGGVFGSGRGRDTASLQSDMANQRGMFLADLYNQGENRALQGAAGLQNVAITQANLFNNLASQSAVARLLKTQEAQDKYNEFQRARNEELARIGLMQEQWQNPMGVITKKGPNTLMKMMGEVMPFVGSYNTQKYGYTTNQTSISDGVKLVMSMFSGGMGDGGGASTGGGVSTASGGGGGLYGSGVPMSTSKTMTQTSGFSPEDEAIFASMRNK